MDLGKCLEKIERFLRIPDALPLIVDVQNPMDLTSILDKFNVGDNRLLQMSDFGDIDEYPRFDNLYNQLNRLSGVIFVVGATSFLKLRGEEDLKTTLQTFASLSVPGHVIFITYQCSEYLRFSDIRIHERTVIVEGVHISPPSIIFVKSEELCPNNSTKINGIKNIANVIERREFTTIYVITKHTRADFPQNMYRISDLNDSYGALCKLDPVTKTIDVCAGTEAQWDFVFSLFKNHNNWESVIDTIFTNHDSLDLSFSHYNELSSDERWFLFIALKIYSTKNMYLNNVSKEANTYEQFIQLIYRALLNIDSKSKEFEKLYFQRKKLVRALVNSQKELSDYCQIVKGTKGRDGIYYLTDLTDIERETIFSILNIYGVNYSRDELISCFKMVYPMLSSYLEPYIYKDNLLTYYFNQYTYLKIINKISDEFYSIVQEQAEKRDFFRILQFRASVVESIPRDSTLLFFIDAMGVEYLSFIKNLCANLDLCIKVHVCRCDLPSITSYNKEFEKLFDDHDIRKPKDLDDIKHHGVNNRDYQSTTLPLHLSEELNIIEKCFRSIKESLLKGDYKRAIVLSDHGSSRLAVIKESESIWSMKNKGEHSGRCVLKSDIDERPQYAADAGDYWSLSNYDRFKGGRKADVEVHGGATLEEVTVPVIEITLKDVKYEIKIASVDESTVCTQVPIVKVSFRKKAIIKIIPVGITLIDPYVVVDGKRYPIEVRSDESMVVLMPDIKSKGIHKVDVYSSGAPVAEGLEFEVKKESGSERELL